MMSELLRLGLGVSQNQLGSFLQGITPQMALQHTCGDGNPVNWILGHILAERVEATELCGAKLPKDLPDLSIYRTGTIPNPKRALPFQELRKLIPATFDFLMQTLEAVEETKLAETLPGTMLGKPRSLGEHLMAYPLHEMYHIGQISLARKSLGLA